MKQISFLLIGMFCFTLFSFGQKNGPSDMETIQDYFSSVKYRSIGPFRGGRSVCASGVIGDPLTYYMGTTGGGLWKTTDAGMHWHNISDGFFQLGSVGAVAVSTSNPNTIYVGMGEHAPRGVMTSHGDGVYKSTDGGKTWKHVGLKATHHIARIRIHPDNPDIVYVAAQGQLYGPNKERGIFRSTNGGETWEQVLFVNELSGCSELDINLSNPNELYATMWEHQRKPWKVISGGEGSGVYKSVDAGDTWKKIETGLPNELGKMAISISQSNPEKIYLLVESNTQKDLGGLFVSTNGGKSWTKVSGDNRLTQRAWYYIEVFADPNDEHTVYVLSAPALRSIDGGKNWERITGTHGDYHDLWINPQNSKNLCIANDGGAAISYNNGTTWSRQDNMPTAQFYRLNVDNHFPYRIYAGQQDNSSVRIENRALGSYGIDKNNWEPSAGGESAFLAFDPDNPRYVMGGSYLGTIELLDTETKASTEVMAAPIQYLGRAARDMKYRYNWNAPTIHSNHEKGTYYHAAQVLLRTRDNGLSWEEVSPDLTRNDDSKQGYGGGPLTNEAVGAENYGTISYVMESPHSVGEFWVTTDDGYVQLTRDNCESWKNVTPKNLQECLVNMVDISPIDAGTAFIATTRYKFNDHSPGLYMTSNFGGSWKNITGDIPVDAYTRVVRQDTEDPKLLFAGTEKGLFISWDQGKKWHNFNLNLPRTPILDLMVKHDDLIVATSGRGIWILDDIGLIRQYDPKENSTKVYDSKPAYLVNGGSPMNGNTTSFDGTNPLRGVNPANGVVIYYHISEVPDSIPISFDIRDEAGTIINSFTSEKEEGYKKYDGGPPPGPTLQKDPGLNRFVWDMRHKMMPGAPESYIEGSYRGHKAIPGRYTLSMHVNDKTYNSELVILPNPLYNISQERYKEYDLFMRKAEKNLTAMHNMVNKMQNARIQLETILKNLPAADNYSIIQQKAEQLVKDMKEWDDKMIQRKSKAYDDVENFENKFTANYLFAINATESDLPRVNNSSKNRINELNNEWKELSLEAATIYNQKLPELNRILWEAGIGSIMLEIKP